jgi:hypothetical protein
LLAISPFTIPLTADISVSSVVDVELFMLLLLLTDEISSGLVQSFPKNVKTGEKRVPSRVVLLGLSGGLSASTKKTKNDFLTTTPTNDERAPTETFFQ